MVTLSADICSGPEALGTLTVLDTSALSVPKRPRKWVRPGSLDMEPDTHPNSASEPSKSWFTKTSSGTQPWVGAAVLGAADGLPGVDVGPAAVVGLVLIGPVVLGMEVVGATEGLPGVTVGPAVEGVPVVGLALGNPGVTVGAPNAGAADGAQS